VRAGVKFEVRQSSPGYEFKRLVRRNADEVFTLYESVSQRMPRGFIAKRTRETFSTVLGSENYSVGAFHQGELVGYQLWVPTQELEFDATRYPRLAQIAGCGRTLFGRGIIIAPGHQRAGLGGRLAAHAAELARAAGYSYQIGQVHVLNIRSLRYVLRFGKTLIGVSKDEFGLNYVSCYFLGRTKLIPNGDESLVRNVDLAAAMLERARIVGINQAGGTERFLYGDAIESRNEEARIGLLQRSV
jgi:GNAT superfamily N-acetyltransferase